MSFLYAVADSRCRKHLLRIFRIYSKKVPLWTLRSTSSSISCGHSSRTRRYERTRLISSCKDILFGRSYRILFYALYASRYDGCFCCHEDLGMPQCRSEFEEHSGSDLAQTESSERKRTICLALEKYCRQSKLPYMGQRSVVT